MLLIFFSLFLGFHLPEDILTYFGCNKKAHIQSNSLGLEPNMTENTQPASDLQPKKGSPEKVTRNIMEQTTLPTNMRLHLCLYLCPSPERKKSQWRGWVCFCPFLTRMIEISLIPGSTHSPPQKKKLASMPSIISLQPN